jgi:hypothetical protein
LTVLARLVQTHQMLHMRAPLGGTILFVLSLLQRSETAVFGPGSAIIANGPFDRGRQRRCCSDHRDWTKLKSKMSLLPTRHAECSREPESPQKDLGDDSQAFATLFSHSGAIWLTGIAKRAIKGAKARVRALGINPDDPSSDDEDPNFKLS